MKNTFFNYIKITLALVLFLQVGEASAQNFITWTGPTGTPNQMSGTYLGGTVTATQGGTGTTFKMAASVSGGITNMNGATIAQSFKTEGAGAPNSKYMIFTFSSPVIINEMSITDIDNGTGGTGWNDAITFSGITFTSVTGASCSYNLTGATSTVTDNGFVFGAEYARWTTSTTPVSSFTINYTTTGTLSHADLFYALKVTSLCAAVANAPTLSATTLTAACPANSMNLNSLVTSTTPAGASLKWYLDAAHTTEVPNPTTLSVSGTFYAFYYDATNNCYSPASASVTTTACPLNKTNACPAASIDLASTVTSTAPEGYTYTYHSATPPTDANKLTSTVVTTPGTYYVAAYFAAQNCYTATSRPMVVTIVDCCATIAPPTFN